jgi:predicted dinucleotide-binding enzyme
VGQAIARRGYAAGYDVRIGTRRNDGGTRRTPDGFPLVDYDRAARGADVLFLALPWPAVLDVARAVAPQLKPSAVIVDCTNPSARLGLMVAPAGSVAEAVAAAVSPTPVIKALNHLTLDELASIEAVEPMPLAFYCGAVGRARNVAAAVLRQLRFTPIDAGSLSSARYLEDAADLFCELSRRLRTMHANVLDGARP